MLFNYLRWQTKIQTVVVKLNVTLYNHINFVRMFFPDTDVAKSIKRGRENVQLIWSNIKHFGGNWKAFFMSDTYLLGCHQEISHHKLMKKTMVRGLSKYANVLVRYHVKMCCFSSNTRIEMK